MFWYVIFALWSMNLNLMEDRTETTLVEAALKVLNTPDPFDKASLGDLIAARWLEGQIQHPYNPSLEYTVPDRPARLTNVVIHLQMQLKQMRTLLQANCSIKCLTEWVTSSWFADQTSVA